MEITSDILLKGSSWSKAIDTLGDIFKTRTNYQIFMLSLAIGIMYDKVIDRDMQSGDEQKSIPRNVISNNDNGKLDFFFQAAILSTETENLTEKERLNLAFGEKSDFNKIAFLTRFANFGVTKLVELIGTSSIETMDNIKNFLFATVEGRNFELDELPEDFVIEM